VTFVASLLLVFVLVVRPQEIWPWLEVLRLLNVLTALVAIGLVVDIALGKQKQLSAPQLPYLLGFVVTCYLVSSLSIGIGRSLPGVTNVVTIPAVFFFAVMYGADTLPRLRAMIGLIIVLGGLVAVVAVHQGNVTPVCITNFVDDTGERVLDPHSADGRVCGLPSDCTPDGGWDKDWACERVGLFGSVSVERRVRWRGQLNDPNELSVFVGGVIPLLLAVGLPFRNAATKRSPQRQKILGFLAVLMVCAGLYAVILSQSRGGQLVIATVFMILFVSRFGKKGIVLAALLALPVLMLGGRSDAAADESTTDRLELMTEGVSLFFKHPVFGVGVEQFADQVDSPLHLTAHNSYLLAAAETGLTGFFFWTGIAWASLKILLTARKRPSLTPEMQVLANALMMSFVGIGVGIFFLSFTYKQLLFVWFGMTGAFYRIMKRDDPSVEVRIGLKDCAGMVLADLAMLGFLWAYTRARGS
jgi:hypothetical protein